MGSGVGVVVGFGVGVEVTVGRGSAVCVVGLGASGAAEVVGAVVPVGASTDVEGGAVEEWVTPVGLAVTAASGLQAATVRASAMAPAMARQRRATPWLLVPCCIVIPCPVRARTDHAAVAVDRTLNRVTWMGSPRVAVRCRECGS